MPLVAVIEPFPYRFMDEAATTYAVPYEWRTEYGIRRYGFHGASHRSASERAQALLGPQRPAAYFVPPGRQLERGCVSQWRGGRHQHGASPQSGLPQNNRVGDIDVFAVLHMMKKLGLAPDEMAALLGSQSGLAGISGTSGDIRDLERGRGQGRQARAAGAGCVCARDPALCGRVSAGAGRAGRDHVFRRHRRKQRGDSRAVLKGSVGLRHRARRRRTTRRSKARARFRRNRSAVKVLVIPANEESIVARETVSVVMRARRRAGRRTLSRARAT